MSAADLRNQLIDLLHETGAAHHRAYFASDGADPDWPLWYAEYLHKRFNQLLGSDCTRSELVYLLVLVEKDRAVNSPAAPWLDYYADFFLMADGAMQGRMPSTPRM